MAEPLCYYFDEHMHSAIAEQLQARGIDVLTVLAAGQANRKISDTEQLAFAASRDRVLVTEDHHFIELARTQVPHSGVVYFPIKLGIGPCVAYLELLALTTAPDEMCDLLVFGRW